MRPFFVFLSYLWLVATAQSSYFVGTLAGNGTIGFAGDGSRPIWARLNKPSGLFATGTLSVWFADSNNHRVRRISSILTPSISTVAGNGIAGYSGDGGPASSAQLSSPASVARAASGILFIADTGNHRVRKINSSTISTVVGSGVQGFSGDGGQGTVAQLNSPAGVACDEAGNLFISDTGNHRVRFLNVSSGVIITIAGSVNRGYSGDNGLGTDAWLYSPLGLGARAGSLYIADTSNNVIRMLNLSTNIIRTCAGTGVSGYSGDGGQGTAAQLNNPEGVSVDSDGNVAITDSGNNRIRIVSAVTGVIITIGGTGGAGYSGDGGEGTSASMFYPAGIASTGLNFVFSDQTNARIRSLTRPTPSSTPVSLTSTPSTTPSSSASESVSSPSVTSTVSATSSLTSSTTSTSSFTPSRSGSSTPTPTNRLQLPLPRGACRDVYDADRRVLHVGDDLACVLLASGAAQCWGYWAQDFETRYFPDAVDVGGGRYFACILTSSGAVRCDGTDVNDKSFRFSSSSPPFVGISHASSSEIMYAFHEASTMIARWSGNSPTTPPTERILSDISDTSGSVLSISNDRMIWRGNQLFAFSQMNEGYYRGGLLPTALSVSRGNFHFCWLLPTGYVSCIDETSLGELSSSNTLIGYGQGTVPIGYSNQSSTMVSCGGYHSCLLTGSGGVLCWGAGSPSQSSGTHALGQATVPSWAETGQAVVVAGNKATCAISITGVVACWGGAAGGLTLPTFPGPAALPCMQSLTLTPSSSLTPSRTPSSSTSPSGSTSISATSSATASLSFGATSSSTFSASGTPSDTPMEGVLRVLCKCRGS